MKYLTREQTRALLTAAREDRLYPVLALGIELGARPNELLALMWKDLDLEHRSVRIRRSLYWPKGGGYELTKPKTKRSNRTVELSAEICDTLRRHKRQQLELKLQKGAKYNDLDLVFATTSGGPLDWRNVAERHLKPALECAGIPFHGIGMYSLRHTSAALLIAKDVHIRIIAERLGTSVAMIDSTYSHVERELDRAVSVKLAATLYA